MDMNNELLTWVAKQMGITVELFINGKSYIHEDCWYMDSPINYTPKTFDPNSNTEAGKAQLYDIEDWLGKEHKLSIIPAYTNAVGYNFSYYYINSVDTYLTREEAIYAACEWVYNNLKIRSKK